MKSRWWVGTHDFFGQSDRHCEGLPEGISSGVALAFAVNRGNDQSASPLAGDLVIAECQLLNDVDLLQEPAYTGFDISMMDMICLYPLFTWEAASGWERPMADP
jgi:hypothetical protein